jgi:hypothetical protein
VADVANQSVCLNYQLRPNQGGSTQHTGVLHVIQACSRRLLLATGTAVLYTPTAVRLLRRKLAGKT